MLDKETKKHLLEQWQKEPYSGEEWDRALKRKDDKNPHQTWYRTRDKAREAIKDLILLANTLPEEKQIELFDGETTRKIIRAILGFDISEKLYDATVHGRQRNSDKEHDAWGDFEAILDIRRVNIAKESAETCINYCTSKYLLTEYSTALCEPVIESLQKSKDLLAAMASKVDWLQKERDGKTEYRGGNPTPEVIERQTMEVLAAIFRNNPENALQWMRSKDEMERKKRKGKSDA